MQINRWEKIEQLFNEALLLPVNNRNSFIEQACRADADLRLELTSLLKADNHADEILEQPIFPIVALLLEGSSI